MESDPKERLDRQRAFWRRENSDRPVVGFTSTYFSTDAISMLRRTDGPLSPADIDVNRFLDDCDANFAAWQGCTGDLFWPANPLWRFRWLAGAMGQDLRVSADTIWAEPILDDYRQLDRLAVSEDNEWIRAMWELTDALVERAAGRYPVAANPVSSPLHALVDARGSVNLALDLYDRPAEVKRALEILTETWVRVTTGHFERIPEWHGGYVSADRHVWAPGRTVEFNEDPSFLFSPGLHEQFVMPSHRALVPNLECAFIHLHSTQLHTLDHLLELDALPAIELTPDYGASIPDLIPAMTRIRACKPLIVHGLFSPEEMRMIVERVPPEGLCVVGRAETPEDALRLRDAVLG